MIDNQNPDTVPTALSADALYRRCDPELFSFATTADAPEPPGAVGQQRALSALQFGVHMAGNRYNLFVMGRAGSHKHRIVQEFLDSIVADEGVPSDWCYVNNFQEDRKPIAIRLPAGKGIALKQDMERLIEELLEAIPAAFESEHYRNRVAEINQEYEDRHRAALEALQEEGQSKNVSLVPTPHGFAIAPTRANKLLSDEEFDRLPEEERERTNQAMADMTEKLRAHIEELPEWHKQRRDRIKALNREVTELAAGNPILELTRRYSEFPEIESFLEAVRNDVLANARDFQPQDERASVLGLTPDRAALRRYEVNVIVDHSSNGRPRIVYESNPSVQNLLGRIEHVSQFGALLTDFTMIRPGALHIANGGYLILDADRVLTQPFAWDFLKRALYEGDIRIESLGQQLGLISTVSLEPEAIPLDIKVILLGDRLIYYLLCELDSDFRELFKVAADFESRVNRTDENTRLYGELIGALARREHLRPLTREAVARVVEHSARLLGDAGKLSTQLRDITDLLSESDYWADQETSPEIDALHIEAAINAQIYRVDRLRSEMQEEIQRNSILIDTEGACIGQVNGLSVVELGGFAFGQPARITATVRIGDGKIVDIERETELGGPIHSKGVLILTSYLSTAYAPTTPLSFGASLVFEQSYGDIEGDSASVAETCALLSALSDLPIRQNLAVTGSVNQHGGVQVIGGVNEKIEGFFDTCETRGLTGNQGVLIPADNVKHLMLRPDVVDAARGGKFHVYPISTVNEAIALLTGVSAGDRDVAGAFPPDSINGRVERKLTDLARTRQKFDQGKKDSRRKSKKNDSENPRQDEA